MTDPVHPGLDYPVVLSCRCFLLCCWRYPQDMVLTDTDALAARRDLADRLKQREYQMAVDADMEADQTSPSFCPIFRKLLDDQFQDQLLFA